MKLLATFRAWLFAAILVFGFVAFTPTQKSTVQQRIDHLESIVRCPACEGLSVAQSNATSSIAVRHEIERRVRAGDTDTAILTSLEDRYGSSILLSPSSRGVGALLWIVPSLIALVAVIVIRRLGRRT